MENLNFWITKARNCEIAKSELRAFISPIVLSSFRAFAIQDLVRPEAPRGWRAM
jgi:hypothetical protein